MAKRGSLNVGAAACRAGVFSEDLRDQHEDQKIQARYRAGRLDGAALLPVQLAADRKDMAA